MLQVVKTGGVYSNGSVTIQPLPLEVHGSAARRTLPLRRIEAVLTPAEVEKHTTKEACKVTPPMCSR